MKCFLKIIAITNIFFLLFPLNFAWAFVDQKDVEISLDVISHCGNYICESELGEDVNTCLTDCACNYNNICEPAIGENLLNCSADCGCNNNGICESERGETTDNCPLDCPAPTPQPPTVPARGMAVIKDTTPPVIFNLFISKITLNSADISWETDEQAFCQLFWGKTPGYKEGAISETAFFWKHFTKITNLSPATTYYFKIVCQDASKNQAETIGQQFTTLFPPDITPPANVANFEAIPEDSQITLTWKNPPDLDFKAVKILRSEDFYPINPWDGSVVYDNKGTSFVDTGLTNGNRYYYTAFAYDKAGNYASGAITSAVPSLVPPVIPPVVPPPAPPVLPAPPEVEKLTIEEFEFIQEGKKLFPVDGKIELKTDLPLTASISYEKVPEVLKTIMVTLEKENKFFSFLLRVNKEKTAYEAIILAPEPGIYPLTISILDYKNQTLKQITGQLEVLKTEVCLLLIPWHQKYRIYIYILLILLGIILGRAITYLFRRKKI